MIASAIDELVPVVGTSAACAALDVSRSTHHRHRLGPRLGPPAPRPTPARALSPDERATALETLRSERFVDSAPAEVVATLLDEGTYLASVRTMYRILAAEGEVRERRAQLRHPAYAAPELLATGPNGLWSWDITDLRGPARRTTYKLHVILDVFSRYVPGWMVAHRESAELAEPSVPTPAPSRASRVTRSRSTRTGAPRCARDRWPCCSPTWASPGPTAGPT